jgi:hypothetical protein
LLLQDGEASAGVATTNTTNIDTAISATGIRSLRIRDTDVASAEVSLLLKATN